MSTELEDQLRATLSTHAQDPEAAPGAGLTERAVRQASRMRRTRRLQVTAGVAVVAALVAAVPLLVGQQRAERNPPAQTPTASQTPTPTVTQTSSGPAANAVEMARATGALLASGMTILDGSTAIEFRPYSPPPEDWTYAIHRLSRAGDGYWVVYGPAAYTGPSVDTLPPPEKLVYVTAETAVGAAVPINATPDSWSELAVEPGATMVAYSETSGPPGIHRLALADPSGGGMGSKRWPIAVTPLGFGNRSVWLDTAAQPRARPYRWDFSTDTVTQLAVPHTEYALAQQGDRMVLSDLASGCISGWDVTDVRHPHQAWQDCGNINLARYSPDGARLVTVLNGLDGHDTIQLRDPATGRVLAHTVLPAGPHQEGAWSADSAHISLTGCCEDEGAGPLVSVLVDKASSGWTLRPTSYPPVQGGTGDVVLGVEPDER